MRLLWLFTLVSLTALADDAPGRFGRFCDRSDQGRTDRGLQCGGAFFEAFPANGAGTSTVCSTTAPTGSRGEPQTFARASSGVCTKTASGGFATSGIANGDLVLLTNDKARVEYDSTGVLGELIEAQGINLLPRFDALTNALWSDVGTPIVVDGATDPFGATTGDTVTDDDPAAFEGRSQPVTVVAASTQYAYCYVKAGTLNKARISLDGTAATITGLSSTTWSIIEVLDASASGVSISFQVTNGSVVGDTGTVIWGGCDVKAATYRTSIVPTAGATATRLADDAKFILSTLTLSNFSIAANFQTPSTTPVMRLHGSLVRSPDDGVNFIGSYQDAPNFRGQFVSTAGTVTVADGATATTGRAASYFDGTLVGACINSTCTTAAKGVFSLANFTNPLAIQVGTYSTTNGNIDGIQTRICFEPNDPTRCR